MFKLQELRKEMGISQQELAKMLGMSQSNVAAIEKTSRDLSPEHMQKVVELFGEDVRRFHDPSRPNNVHGIGNVVGASYTIVPMYSLDSLDSLTEDKGEMIGTVPFHGAKMGDFCVRIPGDSMVPTIPQSSIVLLSSISWRLYIEYCKCYLIVLTDGRRLIKEVRESRVNKDENILLVSHNKRYASDELPRVLIKEMYIVKSMIVDFQ